MRTGPVARGCRRSGTSRDGRPPPRPARRSRRRRAHRASALRRSSRTTPPMHPCAARARAAHHPATRNGSSRRPGAVPRRPRTSHRRTARGGAALHVGRIETGFRVITGERRTPVCLDFGVGAGGVWQKKFTLNGALVRARIAAISSRSCCGRAPRTRASRSPPASHTAIASGPANRPSAPGSAASGKAASSSESSSGKKVVARAGCARLMRPILTDKPEPRLWRHLRHELI